MTAHLDRHPTSVPVPRSRLHCALWIAALALVFLPGCAAYYPAGVDDFVNLLEDGGAPPPGSLLLTFFEVGIGDAFLIEFPSGATLLVDAGIGWHTDAILKYLEARGIHRLDALLLTHPHIDHYGGMRQIAARLPIGAFYSNGLRSGTGAFRKLEATLDGQGVPRRVLRRGDILPELSTGGSLVEVLYPDEAALEAGGNFNHGTIVLRITHGTTRFLLMGDAESKEEQRLLSLEGDLACDVLKLGHHGSPGSGTEAFLRSVQPRLAVAQGTEVFNFPPFYPRPNNRIRRVLAEEGAVLLTGRREGAIQLISDGSGLTWRSIGDRERRMHAHPADRRGEVRCAPESQPGRVWTREATPDMDRV